MSLASTRAVDRHRSAALRATAADPTAELRGARLLTHGQPLGVASPYLALLDDRSEDVSIARARGVADQLGLLLRHSDRSVHRELRPDPLLDRIVFDALEQLRCESRAADLPGLRANLRGAFEAWCHDARARRVAESGAGLIVFTVIHMARARLVGGYADEEVDDLTESTRFMLAPVIGHALKRLRWLTADQRGFAEPALEIAQLVSAVVADSGEAVSTADGDRYRMLVPIDWLDDGGSAETVGADPSPAVPDATELEHLSGYDIFTRHYDSEVRAVDLYPAATLSARRADLDQHDAAQAVSPQRLAERMRRLFGSWQEDDWRFAQEDGLVDGRRLGQLVAGAATREVFRHERAVLRSDTVVAFLVDNSGSMKRQRYLELAVMIDTFSRALDLAGVSNEVLGFTTASWAGGRSRADWVAAGRPPAPGRLADAMLVVYKDADQPWRRARSSLAALLQTHHYREGIDGEAVTWAHQRLLSRPEPRKVLVVVSDGAPMETSTATANSEDYLEAHLAAVVEAIERRSPVELGALTIDAAIDAVYGRSVGIDLDTTLTIGTYGALDFLFNR